MPPAWNYENAAHLLRRAAFGGTPEQIRAFLAKHPSVASAVDELLAFKADKKKPPNPTNDDRGLRKIQAWWLSQMVNAGSHQVACQEKLTLFWHGHLVSGASKQPTLAYMCGQNGLFRFHARGNFRTLVREFARDPANLYYLDGITNVASTDRVHVSANENLSRELMELFVLGVFQFKSDGTNDPTRPNYTEDDVHQLARALTGWTSIRNNLGVFDQGDWDGGQYDDDGDDLPDPVTVFGQTNSSFRIDAAVAGTANDVLQLLFSRTDYEGVNQTALFLARKLWTWYGYAAPAPGLKTLLNGFAALFAGGNFELTPLLRAMWNHDEFYSARAKSRTVKNPVDYVVQSLRAFGVKSNGAAVGTGRRELGEQIALMGMTLFDPPSVGGWPGGLAWISVGTLLARCEFAKDLAAVGRGPEVDLRKVAGLIGNATANPGDTVDRVLAQLGLNALPVGLVQPSSPAPLTATQRAALIAYVTDDGARTTLNLKTDSTTDAKVKVRGLVALALQAAEQHVF